jgi:hypothetical protein
MPDTKGILFFTTWALVGSAKLQYLNYLYFNLEEYLNTTQQTLPQHKFNYVHESNDGIVMQFAKQVRAACEICYGLRS